MLTLIFLTRINQQNGKVGLMFEPSYVHHNGTRFLGWNGLNTPADRIEWLDHRDGDDDLNIYMMVQ